MILLSDRWHSGLSQLLAVNSKDLVAGSLKEMKGLVRAVGGSSGLEGSVSHIIGEGRELLASQVKNVGPSLADAAQDQIDSSPVCGQEDRPRSRAAMIGSDPGRGSPSRRGSDTGRFTRGSSNLMGRSSKGCSNTADKENNKESSKTAADPQCSNHAVHMTPSQSSPRVGALQSSLPRLISAPMPEAPALATCSSTESRADSGASGCVRPSRVEDGCLTADPTDVTSPVNNGRAWPAAASMSKESQPVTLDAVLSDSGKGVQDGNSRMLSKVTRTPNRHSSSAVDAAVSQAEHILTPVRLNRSRARISNSQNTGSPVGANESISSRLVGACSSGEPSDRAAVDRRSQSLFSTIIEEPEPTLNKDIKSVQRYHFLST